MSIFKKKSKAEKDKDGKKQEGTEKPTKPVYKHVPKHAASDAGPKSPGSQLSQEALNYANGPTNAQSPPSINGNGQITAQGNGRHAPLPPYRGFNGGFDTRSNSAEVFTTDPDAPPLPVSLPVLQHNNTRDGVPRKSSGYFAQRDNMPSFESSATGNPKMATPAGDRVYVNPHDSLDSGYGSGPHSRAPSEHGNVVDFMTKPHLSHNDSDFLPKMSLSEELAREPAFSEASFGGEEPAERQASAYKTSHATVRSEKQHDDTKSRRLSKSSKSQRAKQANTGPVAPRLSLNENARHIEQPVQPPGRLSPSAHLPELVQEVRPESATLPPPTLAKQQNISGPTSTSSAYETAKSGPPTAMRHSLPGSQQPEEFRSQSSVLGRASMQLFTNGYDQPQNPMRHSSPLAAHQQPAFSPLERIISAGQRSTAPSTGILEGCKVNKRGKILDEEGEVIGELVEGDIIDCVRQRCNAYGEVLDDYGRVVGRVQLLERSQESPISRIASPPPFTPPIAQPRQYFSEMPRRVSQPRPMSPATVRSHTPQPTSFTPAWQQQTQSSHSGLAQELRDHLASGLSSTPHGAQYQQPQKNVEAVELEASHGHSERRLDNVDDDDDEVLPIFDYSDVFMPPPSVPERSAARSATPSPPTGKSRPQSQPGPRITPPTSSNGEQNMMESPRVQSMHIAGPTASRAQRSNSPARFQQDARKEASALARPSSPALFQQDARKEALALVRPNSPALFQQDARKEASALVRPNSPALFQQDARKEASALVRPNSPALFQQDARKEASGLARPTSPAMFQQEARREASITGSPVSSKMQLPSVAQWAAQLHSAQPQGVRTSSESPSAAQQLEPQQTTPVIVSPAEQQTTRQTLPRIATSVVNDAPKSFSRPTMSPVAEDGNAAQKKIPAAAGPSQNAAIFSYKGEIPAADGPQSNIHLAPNRATGVKSPPLPSFPKQAFVGGLPSGSPFAPMKSAQFSSAGGLGPRNMPPRQFSTGVPGPRTTPSLQSRNSYTRVPLKRSPLSSTQNTPPDSDQGSSDGHQTIGLASGGHSRTASIRSMQSTATSKPRTYFTHGGRVTVEEGQLTPAQAAAAGKKPEPEPAPSVISEKKKKSRFSMSWGKKEKS